MSRKVVRHRKAGRHRKSKIEIRLSRKNALALKNKVRSIIRKARRRGWSLKKTRAHAYKAGQQFAIERLKKVGIYVR